MQSFWQAARGAGHAGLRDNAARQLVGFVATRPMRTFGQRELHPQRSVISNNAGAFRCNSRFTGQKQAPPISWRSAPNSGNRSDAAGLLGVAFGASAVAYVASLVSPKKSETEQDEHQINNVPEPIEIADADSKTFRLAEVSKHNRDAESKWVTHETAVYDITAFVEQHPGGEVILRACGGPIDPYWNLFSIHKKAGAFEILKQYYIGDVDPSDLDDSGKVDWSILGPEAGIVDDPFKLDPERDPALIVHTAKPCNAETPGSMLVDFLTPLRLFFVRHHFWVPQGNDAKDSVVIEFSDGEEKSYSLDDLKSKFKAHTVTVTLQCSGNRRSHMSKAKQGKTAGLQWDIGAIGTAEFTGVRLRDVFKDAGYCVDGDCPSPAQQCDDSADQHVEFVSNPGDTYAASIPLEKVLNAQGDVLLAWNMNGQPLNREHGGPIRAIVPGITAARSVKWLGRVVVGRDESTSQWQKRDYKLFGPNVLQSQCTPQLWDEAEPINETPVQSAITNISREEGEEGKQMAVQGFAFSGGGRRIVRVDVSSDGGKTWRQADLQKDQAKGSKRWCWTLWKIDWPVDDLSAEQATQFVVKATDDSYNQQPAEVDGLWNFRGLLTNSWHRKAIAPA